MDFPKDQIAPNLSDRLEDIAAYTVEKNEFFGQDELSPEQQEEAKKFVLEALEEVATEYGMELERLRDKCMAAAKHVMRGMLSP